MAINIQEILHPSDSDAIKFEKINYNFDQIVANGGGLQGEKGAVGSQGAAGSQGQKGLQGEKGETGATGATTSRWQVIPAPFAVGAQPSYSILKPKREGDTHHPTVFLGDQSFDDSVQGSFGREIRSTLTIGHHATALGDASSELLTFWHGANDTHPTVLSGITWYSDNYTENGQAGVKYKLSERFGQDPQSLVETSLEFDTDRFIFADNTKIEFLGQNSRLKLPTSAFAANEAGLIRFNGTGFYGSVSDGNGGFTWKEFCMDPCGQGGSQYQISIVEDFDLNLDVNGYVIGQSISMDDNSDVTLDGNGDIWDGTATTTTTTTTTSTTTATPTTQATPPPPPAYTLTFPGGDNTVSAPAGGGTFNIEYETGPTPDLALTAEPTYPSWITVSGYVNAPVGQSGAEAAQGSTRQQVSFTVPAQAVGGESRSGDIILEHPNDSSITATITVNQAAYVAEFTFADWVSAGGNMSVLANGLIAIDESIADSVTADPTQWPANETPGTESRVTQLTVIVPAGYSNTGQPVVGTLTRTQPTSYVAPNTYTTTWNVVDNIANAYITYSDTSGSPVGDQADANNVAGSTASEQFFIVANTNYAFSSVGEVNVTVSQGSVTKTLLASGRIRVNVSRTQQSSNETITTTFASSGGPVSTLVSYDQFVASPLTLEEGSSITLTINTTNVPNGTTVWAVASASSTSEWADWDSESSGHGSGRPAWTITINNNTGSRTFNTVDDAIIEGNETLILELESTDSAGNATGGLSQSITITDNDNEYTLNYNVAPGGQTGMYNACQGPNSYYTQQSVTYNPANGASAWRDAVVAAVCTGSQTGFFINIISSNEPSFAHAGWAFNCNTPTLMSQCSGVTLPEFTCSEAGLSIADGADGNLVTGTVANGTIDSYPTPVYSAGTSTYSAVITIPSGYSNYPGTITCSDSGVIVTQILVQEEWTVINQSGSSALIQVKLEDGSVTTLTVPGYTTNSNVCSRSDYDPICLSNCNTVQIDANDALCDGTGGNFGG